MLSAFWLPAAFLLTAIPWSTSAEQSFIANAIPLTGRIASELLWMVGVGAVDSGKSLYTSLGPILISEDCSGIRSFHLAIMAACFWIGYFRLTKGKAIWMGIAAVGLTLSLNILRVVMLVGLVVKSNQMAMMDRWHDTMGSIAQFLLVLALPAVAWILGRTKRPRPVLNPSLAWHAPLWVPIAILIWQLGVLAAAETWFRLHERPAQLSAEYWGINLKPPGLNPQETPVAANVKENYFYSEGHNLNWRDSKGALWTLLYMDFNQGALSACTHNIHRPEVCLAMADFTLLAVPPPLKVVISGREITLAHKIFQRANHPVHLFHTYLQNTADEDSRVDWTYQGRLRAALLGIRSHRAELVYFMVEAPYSPDQAKETASGYLSQLLVRKSN